MSQGTALPFITQKPRHTLTQTVSYTFTPTHIHSKNPKIPQNNQPASWCQPCIKEEPYPLSCIHHTPPQCPVLPPHLWNDGVCRRKESQAGPLAPSMGSIPATDGTPLLPSLGLTSFLCWNPGCLGLTCGWRRGLGARTPGFHPHSSSLVSESRCIVGHCPPLPAPAQQFVGKKGKTSRPHAQSGRRALMWNNYISHPLLGA